MANETSHKVASQSSQESDAESPFNSLTHRRKSDPGETIVTSATDETETERLLRSQIRALQARHNKTESLIGALQAQIDDLESRSGNDRGEIRKSLNDFDDEPAQPESVNSETFNNESLSFVDTKNATREASLDEDTYSFMISAPIWSPPFFVSIAVCCLQVLTYSLLTINITDTDSDNPLSIPPNVDRIVRFCQFIAMFITVITQDDVRSAYALIHDGYSKKRLGQAFDASTFNKWLFCIVCRMGTGALGLTVTFFLIIITDTVFDLLLNFTAMEFVSQIDNVTFFLGSNGLFGSRVKLMTKDISNTTFPIKKQRKKIHQIVLLILMFGGMLAGWGIVIQNQNSGKYLCDVIYVQFGDEAFPALGTFSGLYDRSDGEKENRVVYTDRRSEDKKLVGASVVGTALFAYCGEERAWTFAIGGANADDVDPCDWLAKSTESLSYDLLDASTSQWFVKVNDRTIELQPFQLRCYDCEGKDGGDMCGEEGNCVDNACICNDGWFGLNCEFPDPCSSLEIDSRFDGFTGSRDWSDHFETLELQDKTVVVYEHPVYVHEYDVGLFDIIMFIGRRWIATYSGMLNVDIANTGSTNKAEDNGKNVALAQFLLNEFHAYWSDFEVAFASEPMDFGTPMYAMTPVGIDWFHVHPQGRFAPDSSQKVEAVMLCTECSAEGNPCLYDGICVNQTCSCSTGSLGTLCQIPPLGNGRCDPFFNFPAFSFDGGDCCRSTCISSKEYSCGKDDTGYVDIGYENCAHLNQKTRSWYPFHQIEGDLFSASGTSVALSKNGGVLAVGEPGANVVKLFDQDGAEWILRGRPIQGPEDSDFGRSVAIASGRAQVVSNPGMKAHVTVVVGAPLYNNSVGTAVVFKCTTEGCSQVGNNLPAHDSTDSFGSFVDISSDGKRVAVGAFQFSCPRGDGNGYTRVFELDGNEWTVLGHLQEMQPLSLTLSGNGNVLASGSFATQSNDFYNSHTRGECRGRSYFPVSVFTWEGHEWVQKGKLQQPPLGEKFVDWDRKWEIHAIAETFSSKHQQLSLSHDGDTLAGLFSSRGVEVFDWNGTDWVQRGFPFGNIISDCYSWSVSLSAKGNVVSVSRAACTVKGRESVATFEWNGTGWGTIGQVEGGASTSVALAGGSGSSYILAVGMPFYRLNQAGITTVYEFPTQCDNGSTLFRLSLVTNKSPHLTTWTLVNQGTGDLILGGGRYDEMQKESTVVEEVCIPIHICAIFSFYEVEDSTLCLAGVSIGASSMKCEFSIDIRGVNFEPQGRYNISLGGKEIATNPIVDFPVSVGQCGERCPDDTPILRLLLGTSLPLVWKFFNDAGGQLLSGQTGSEMVSTEQRFFWEETCLSGCVVICFTWVGAQDSIQSTGSVPFVEDPFNSFRYRIFVENEIEAAEDYFTLIARSKNFESHDCTWLEQICPEPSSSPTESPVPTTTPTKSLMPTSEPSSLPTRSSAPTNIPTVSAVPTSAPTSAPTNIPTISAVPTSAPTSLPTIECGVHFSLLRLELTTDSFPGETSWDIINKANNQTISKDGPYDSSHSTHVAEACIRSTWCSIFTIRDSYGDGLSNPGYGLFLDGKLIKEKEGFDGSESINHIGNCTSEDAANVTTVSTPLP